MIYIGTSGYSYPYWKNRFYPEGLSSGKWLSFYATQFNTVELNASFYRFPKEENLKKAAKQTPEHFKFSIKAHKIISHTRRMRDAREKIAEFGAIVRGGLMEKLAFILYQMPPSYNYTDERLDDIIEHLGPESDSVIEFRHSSWWQLPVFMRLEEAGIRFCSVSFPCLPEDNITLCGTLYKRMHGVPELFKSTYDQETLLELSQVKADREIFVYFNNTMFEGGYTNALALQTLFREDDWV